MDVLARGAHRAGYRVGLFGNVATPYKDRLLGLGIQDLCDFIGFSCEDVCTQPSLPFLRKFCVDMEVAVDQTMLVRYPCPCVCARREWCVWGGCVCVGGCGMGGWDRGTTTTNDTWLHLALPERCTCTCLRLPWVRHQVVGNAESLVDPFAPRALPWKYGDLFRLSRGMPSPTVHHMCRRLTEPPHRTAPHPAQSCAFNIRASCLPRHPP